VKILAGSSKSGGYALALVAAHTLECVLKAYLSRNGSAADLKTRKLRHNIVGLWAKAVADNLQVPSRPPHWVENLSRVHNEPYYLRYAEGIHGIVLPAREPMASELAALLELVRKAIN
jgi:hypothetical protein